MLEEQSEPPNVRDLLTEMRDISDLMMDLAYSSLLFENKEIANQVGKLESKMDGLMYQIRALAAVSVRNLDDAKKVSGVLQIANAAEGISNATGDLANIVRDDLGVHPIIKDVLKKTEERFALIRVGKRSKILEKKLSEFEIPIRLGVWVLALKRGESWVLPLEPETEFKSGDKLIVRGPQDGIDAFCEMTNASKMGWSVGRKYKRLKETLADMRDKGSLMVDMAYSSVLFKSKEVAEEVRELEEKFDELNYEVWKEVLKAAKREKDVTKLNSVLQFVKSIERISDAADLIADLVLREVELHPVFEKVVEESEERIARVEVSEDSVLANHILEKLDLLGWRGAYPLMIKRKDHYIFNPTKKVTVRPGDRLIITGSKLGVEHLKRIAMGKKEMSAS